MQMYALRVCNIFRRSLSTAQNVLPKEVPKRDPDLPISMKDPYSNERKLCFICQHNIPLDYKNVRLLSQFVSPYTGRIYGRHITGLCIPMQKRVSKLIIRSRQFGYMTFERKEHIFLADRNISKSWNKS